VLQTHIARYHNIFGPQDPWEGGREKAPAAICRKVAMARDGDTIDIWGDGEQTRSFLYIDDCPEGTLTLPVFRGRQARLPERPAPADLLIDSRVSPIG
jgi:nucleoside-diphosphate-sugar epimerase